MAGAHTEDPAVAVAGRVGNNEKSTHRGESIDEIDAVPTYDPTPVAVTHPWNDEKSSLGGGDGDHEVLDEVHAGLIFPTEEEKLTLRRVADTIPWGAYSKLELEPHRYKCLFLPLLCPVIAMVELAERFSVSLMKYDSV